MCESAYLYTLVFVEISKLSASPCDSNLIESGKSSFSLKCLQPVLPQKYDQCRSF